VCPDGTGVATREQPVGVHSRALLAALATAVVDAARVTGMADLPEPYLGADVAASPHPYAKELRAAEVSFDWLAFAHPGASMWEAHVGVIHSGHGAYDVGVHYSSRLTGAEEGIRQVADSLGRTSTYSEHSREHQVFVRRVNLPEQEDEAARLTLELFQYLTQ
jgi:hypothetical protein